MNVKVTQTARLDKALESAVAKSWNELVRHSPMQLVHIEYQTDHLGSLEFLKVWASNTRGHWDLIFEKWLQVLWSNPVGVKFANGYRSTALQLALESATADGTSRSYLPDHHRLIQVYPPVPAEPLETHTIGDVTPIVSQTA